METIFNAHTWLVVAHILGVALGAGGAFASDRIFLTGVKNRHITEIEAHLLGVLSKMVWLGLIILILSGVGLVLLRPEIFLSSGKFWIKMTIVGIISINGLIFHFSHLPLLRRSHREGFFSKDHELVKGRMLLLVSGVFSVISWTYVIILGVLRRTPFGYFEFMGAYLFLLLVGLVFAYLFRNRIIPTE